jgi:peroxiredoxin
MNFLNTYKWHILIFPILIGLGILSATALKNSNSFNEISKERPGQVVFNNKPLPKTELFDYKSKIDFNLQLQKGKILLVYISTDCNSCKNETEIIVQNDLAKNLDIRVIGVSMNDEASIEEFARNNKINFPILVDKSSKLREELGVTVFPTNFVVNDGIIEKYWLGASQDFSEMSEKITSSSIK